MNNVYNRRMFKMAQGGMMPPPEEGVDIDSMALMTPEEEVQLAQSSAELPREVYEEADQGLQELTGDLLSQAVPEVAQEEAQRSALALDGATDFKGVMNAVWDEDLDIPAYRSRLAEVVGPSDAEQTPESVLALVQPTLQLAQLDRGVGALMQEELAEVGGLPGGIAELATKSAVADSMAAETGALVDTVGGMSQGPMPMGQGQGIMALGPEASGMDPAVLQAMMQGAGPTGQGTV